MILILVINEFLKSINGITKSTEIAPKQCGGSKIIDNRVILLEVRDRWAPYRLKIKIEKFRYGSFYYQEVSCWVMIISLFSKYLTTDEKFRIWGFPFLVLRRF